MKPARKTSRRLRNAASVRKYRVASLQRVLENGKRSDRKRYAERRADPKKIRDYWNSWRKDNIDRERMRGRINIAIRRARLFSSGGVYQHTDIVTMYAAQRGKCAVFWCCADLSEKYHVDHIVALANGGSSNPENLQLLCPSCNMSKADDSMFNSYLRKVGGGHLRI